MNQLKAGVILSYVIIGITMLTGILFTPIKLRLLGQSEFGMYALATAVIGYLAVMDFGFSNAVIRYTSRYRAEGKIEEQYKLFGMFLKVYSFIGIIAFILGLILTFNVDSIFSKGMTIYELSQMRIIMFLMTFNLSVNFPIRVFAGAITAYENFIWQRCLRIMSMLLITFSTLALLLIGYKAVALVLATTVMNIFNFSLNIWYCFRKLKIKIIFDKIDFSLFKEVSVYSFWVFLNALVDKFYWSTGQFVLGMYNGTKSVAIYAVAIQLKGMYNNFSTAFSSVLLPKITAISIKENSEKELSNIFIKVGRLQFILMSLITSGFVVMGRPFVNLWAGKDYSQAYIIVVMLFSTSLVPLVQNTGIVILQAKNKMRFRCILYTILATTTVIFMIIFAKEYGPVACGMITAIAILIGQGFIMNIYYNKVIKLDIIKFWKEILKMAIIPILLTFAGYYYITSLKIESLQTFIVYSIVYSSIYMILLWIFSMNDYERNTIKQIFNKILKRK